jgi:hypothetical protein
MKKRQRDDALKQLSEADRMYRAAFRKLTSRGGRSKSSRKSFEELVAATERLQSAARDVLPDRDEPLV